MNAHALNDVQAAAFLGLAPQTLRNMRVERRGPVYRKLGSRVIYLQRDLEAYLEARRVDPEGGNGSRVGKGGT